MAETKWTEVSTTNTDPLSTDIIIMVDDPGGTPASQKVTMATLQGFMAAGMYPGGRLTLTTATPVTTADVTAAATLYYTPYIHDNIRLYDGAVWRTVTFTEKSITLVGTTASKPYDVWGYLSGGTLALELLVWTNATTRATALAYQNGRLVKNGAATRLYLGSIYVNSSGGQTDDSAAKRNVFNYYNALSRSFYVSEANSHGYTTGAWRAWNNNAANRVEYLCGVIERTSTYILSNTLFDAIGSQAYVGCAIDATNTITSGYPAVSQDSSMTANVPRWSSSFETLPTLGFHYISVNQYGATSASFGQFFFSGHTWG